MSSLKAQASQTRIGYRVGPGKTTSLFSNGSRELVGKLVGVVIHEVTDLTLFGKLTELFITPTPSSNPLTKGGLGGFFSLSYSPIS